MESELSILGFVLILSALTVSGCGSTTAQPSEISTPVSVEPVVEPLTVIPATTPTIAVEASDARAAHDAALTYIIEHYAEQAPALGLTWREEFTPERPFHLASCQYTAGDWGIAISYRTLPVVYQVVVTNQPTSFRWEGTVDASGQVTEQLAPGDVRAARDTALAYVIEHYDEQAPPLGLPWTEQRTTPEVWVGSGTYQYTAEHWVITMWYPMVPAEKLVYQVVAANRATGFHWEGQVDGAGRVTEPLDDVLAARDAALAYVTEHYGEGAPALSLTWAEGFIGVPIPEGPWGAGTFQYTYMAEDWAVITSYQFLAPKPVVYRVVLTNQVSRFHWEGEVDAAGQVTEEAVHIGG